MTGTLIEVRVTTRPEAEEAVTELLARVFGRPASVYSNEKTKVSRASVFCERAGEWTRAKHHRILEGLKEIRAIGLPAGRISVRRMPREDWAESWKRHFKAMDVFGRLLVKPGWVKRKPRAGQAVVVLDPGLSFGTGNHPTTAFCLKALVRLRGAGRKSLLDLGTGSGILAIAASKLGYAPVEALDFDAEAVRIAKENARKNRAKIKVSRGDVTKLLAGGRRFDVVCANLQADLLIAESRRIAGKLARGGRLVVAGILRREFASVVRAYESRGLELVKCGVGGEWRSGIFEARK